MKNISRINIFENRSNDSILILSETGSREDSAGLLQQLKRNFKNQRITASDILASKDIANTLSDFKDMVTFTKKGLPFVDVTPFEMSPANLKVDDLEDQRKEIIALSGIPSSYLGWPEPMELREQLVHVNVSLATEISNIQENFNENIGKILDRIFEICECKHKPTKYLKIHLFPPVVLILQLIESTLTSTSNILNLFRDVPSLAIDAEYLLKQYVPFVDWKAVLDSGSQAKVKKAIETEANPQAANANQQPMGGGF